MCVRMMILYMNGITVDSSGRQREQASISEGAAEYRDSSEREGGGRCWGGGGKAQVLLQMGNHEFKGSSGIVMQRLSASF